MFAIAVNIAIIVKVFEGYLTYSYFDSGVVRH